jgi:hypothetical protein
MIDAIGIYSRGASSVISVVVFFGRAEAEDFVHFVDDGETFAVGEFAVRIFEFLDFGAGLGAGVAIFLVAQSFPGDAWQGGEEAGIGFGLVFDGGGEVDGVELFEELVEAHGSGFEGDVFEF